jgi:hypothetical protein
LRDRKPEGNENICSHEQRSRSERDLQW